MHVTYISVSKVAIDTNTCGVGCKTGEVTISRLFSFIWSVVRWLFKLPVHAKADVLLIDLFLFFSLFFSFTASLLYRFSTIFTVRIFLPMSISISTL